MTTVSIMTNGVGCQACLLGGNASRSAALTRFMSTFMNGASACSGLRG